MAPLGFIAVVAGWTTTEVGRQPWTVYGLLRTADFVSPSLTGADVVLSLACYVVVYLIMFPTGIALSNQRIVTPHGSLPTATSAIFTPRSTSMTDTDPERPHAT